VGGGGGVGGGGPLHEFYLMSGANGYGICAQRSNL